MSTGISKIVAVGMVTAEPVIEAGKGFIERVKEHMHTLKNPQPSLMDGVSEKELREALELIKAKQQAKK